VKEDLKLLQPMLEALKSGNQSDIAKYEDIVPMDIEDYILNRLPVLDLKARVQAKKEKMAQDRTNKELPILEKLILSLINLDVSEKIAENAAKYALKNSPESTIPQLMTLSLQYIEGKKEKKNEAKGNISVNKLQSIVDIGKKNKRSAYEALCEEGYIKNPLDDLIM